MLPQAIGDHAIVPLPAAESIKWTVEAGWGYAFTDTGAGRSALRTGVDASSVSPSSLPGGATAWNGLVDLAVAHEVQPTTPHAHSLCDLHNHHNLSSTRALLLPRGRCSPRPLKRR